LATSPAAAATALTTTTAASAGTAALGFDDVGHLVTAGKNTLTAGFGLKRAFVADAALAEFVIRVVAALLLTLPALITTRFPSAIALLACRTLVTGFALFAWEIASTILTTAALSTLLPALALPLIAALAFALTSSWAFAPKGCATKTRLLPALSLTLVTALLLTRIRILVFLRRVRLIVIPVAIRFI
jgi:hypothetical protein